MEVQNRVFTICGVVNFYPEINLLINNINRKQTTLNWPTSQCLLLLLKNQGLIVPKNHFMEYVWGTKNIIVTKNTFVQNISLLRSSLEYIGVPKSLVKTIKGEGYTIPINYEITLQHSSEMPVSLSTIVPAAQETIEKTDSPPSLSSKKSLFLRYYPLYLVAVSVLILLFWLYYLVATRDNSTANYRYMLTHSDGCSFFFAGDDAQFIKATLFVENIGIMDCKKYKHIYITAYLNTNRLSVIQCNMAINTINPGKNCTSAASFDYDEKTKTLPPSPLQQ